MRRFLATAARGTSVCCSDRPGRGSGRLALRSNARVQRQHRSSLCRKPERANGEGLKVRLEKQLAEEATPEGKWTGIMFRFGRGVKEITSPPSPKGDWTDHAFRLGRMLRRGIKR